MALRFQNKDEVDHAVKDERSAALFSCLFLFVLIAVISGIGSWLSGGTVRAYEKDLAELFAVLLALWFVSPIYYEFRIRTKETHGTVTEIEKAMSVWNTSHEEVLKRLDGLEDDLRSLKYEQRPSMQHSRLPLPD